MLPFCLVVGGLHPDTGLAAFLTSGGTLTPAGSFPAAGQSASYAAFSPDGRRAYIANHGIPSAGVTALALTWSPGAQGCLASAAALAPLVPSPDPCHVAVHPSGQWLFSASYSEGSVSVFPIAGDGALGQPLTTALGSHAHMCAFAQGGEEVLVPLLGSDALAVLAFNASTGQLALKQMLPLPPGSGPRHVALHPTLPGTAYLVLELSSSVAVLQRSSSSSSSNGSAWQVLGAPVSTLRPGLPLPTLQAAAALAVSPDSRHLYVSNRAAPPGAGDNSIACLALSAEGGVAGGAPASWATGGPGLGQALDFPRDCALSQDGLTLAAASQHSGQVTLFARDVGTGQLSYLASAPSSPLAAPSFVHWAGGGNASAALAV